MEIDDFENQLDKKADQDQVESFEAKISDWNIKFKNLMVVMNESLMMH